MKEEAKEGDLRPAVPTEAFYDNCSFNESSDVGGSNSRNAQGSELRAEG